jgi:hypothetical protein
MIKIYKTVKPSKSERELRVQVCNIFKTRNKWEYLAEIFTAKGFNFTIMANTIDIHQVSSTLKLLMIKILMIFSKDSFLMIKQ